MSVYLKHYRLFSPFSTLACPNYPCKIPLPPTGTQRHSCPLGWILHRQLSSQLPASPPPSTSPDLHLINPFSFGLSQQPREHLPGSSFSTSRWSSTALIPVPPRPDTINPGALRQAQSSCWKAEVHSRWPWHSCLSVWTIEPRA